MIKKLQQLKAKKGFTLVELIVVIAIIGVLAAILIPTMMGFVTSSRVTSANSTTSSLKNQVDNFLTAADTAGYGMKKSDSAIAGINFAVDASGEWTVQLSAGAAATSTGTTGADAFKTGGPHTWTAAAASTTSGGTKVSATSAQQLLAYELKDLFPEIKSSCGWVYVVGGKAMYAWYTADAADYTANMAIPTAANFAAGSYSWDNNTAGVTSDGLTMGTAPALALGTGTTPTP